MYLAKYNWEDTYTFTQVNVPTASTIRLENSGSKVSGDNRYFLSYDLISSVAVTLGKNKKQKNYRTPIPYSAMKFELF